MRGTLVCLCVAIGPIALSAQTASPPSFEVASVKRSVSADAFRMTFASFAGTLRVVNHPLKTIIALAYGIGPDQSRPDLTKFKLVDNGAEVLSARFDINAKPPEGVGPEQHMAMLRTLLAERFGLRIRTDHQPRPIYVLTVARGGLRLKPSTYNCATDLRPRPDGAAVDPRLLAACGRLPATRQAPMSRGVRYLASAGPLETLMRDAQFQLDRPLVDGTGLTGNFEWETSFGLSLDIDAVSIFDAFERDLGLKIEARTDRYEVLVIDAVTWPTPD